MRVRNWLFVIGFGCYLTAAAATAGPRVNTGWLNRQLPGEPCVKHAHQTLSKLGYDHLRTSGLAAFGQNKGGDFLTVVVRCDVPNVLIVFVAADVDVSPNTVQQRLDELLNAFR